MKKAVLILLSLLLPATALASDLSYGNKFAVITPDNALKVDGSAVVQPVSCVSGCSGSSSSVAVTTITYNGVSQPVTVGNFPASQAVTGTFYQGTQPVSGTFWQSVQPVSESGNWSMSVSNFPATQPVSGSFWQATQPVSIATMPTTPVTGTFWPATQPVSGTFWQATQPVSIASMPSTPVTGSFWQTTQPVSIAAMPSTPVTGTFWQATQPVSIASMPSTPVTGTFWQATQPISGTVTVTPPTLTKGSQGATGFSVQNLNDAGRNYVVLVTTSQTGATSESLLLFGKTVQGTATASQTNYTPTSGKTLRCTSASYSIRSGAAAIGFVKFALRHNTAGATTASSSVAYQFPEINTNSATSGTGAYATIPIPEGIEFYGNGTQTIGISQFAQAVTNLITFTLNCYEY